MPGDVIAAQHYQLGLAPDNGNRRRRVAVRRFINGVGYALDAPYVLAGDLVDGQDVRGRVGRHAVKHLQVQPAAMQQW